MKSKVKFINGILSFKADLIREEKKNREMSFFLYRERLSKGDGVCGMSCKCKIIFDNLCT